MRVLLGIGGMSLLLMAGACGRAPQVEATTQTPAAPQTMPNTQTAAASDVVQIKRELLALAMEAATAIPLQPHIKDRCRAQGQVVSAALELDLLPEAMAYAEKISDWRRGEAYGELAIYAARHGDSEQAVDYIAKAELISRAQGLEEWRRDAIRVKLAQAHVFLKDEEAATKVERMLGAVDVARVASARAEESVEENFERQVKSIDALTGGRSLDITQSALEASLKLYDRHYGDSGRRAQAEQAIRKGWTSLPIFLRIDVLLHLSDIAIGHGDKPAAAAFVAEAESEMKGAIWRIEDSTPLAARLVQYRFRAGKRENAGESLRAILAKYEAEKEQMLNIERVTALLPVAEAWLVIGDRKEALSVYALAAEESVVNPNSRPRALDLAAICRAMALANCEPDARLWARLREIRKGLGDPW